MDYNERKETLIQVLEYIISDIKDSIDISTATTNKKFEVSEHQHDGFLEKKHNGWVNVKIELRYKIPTKF